MKINTLVAFLLLLGCYNLSAQTTDSTDIKGVEAALRCYLGGAAQGDTTLFKQAFLPEGQMIFIRDGKTTIVPLKDFVARLKPGVKSERASRILDLEITGTAANARLEIVTDKVIFYDFMHLLKTENGWKIVNKIFYVANK